MNNKARIASYLAQGLKPSQVCSIVGVTAAYISQLLKEAKENPDGEFAKLLQEYASKEAEVFSEDKALTNKYMSIEHTILNAIEGQLAFAELPALSRALEVVANRQEKRLQRLTAPRDPNGTVIHNVIQLTIPAHAIPEHVISSNKEVVAIGNQQLAPLSADGVKNLFSQIQASKQAVLASPVTIENGSEF
jgi:transcriptional regulator with XRE-family HTH domain